MKRTRHKKQKKQRSWGGTRDPTQGYPGKDGTLGQQQIARVQNQNRLLSQGFVSDGYQNRLAGLGEASPLISDGTWVRNGLTGNEGLLTTLYRESWLAKRIVDMPSEDMTRAWIRISADVDVEDMRLVEKAMKTHNVRKELTDAVRWARLYGGSLAVMVLAGEEDRLDQPLRLAELRPDSFRGLLVLDRTCGITPSLETVSDLDDPDYGLPEYYQAEMSFEGHPVARIHHSRVLRFVGRELPYAEMVYENSWGASELEHIWEELQKRSATSANIAQLVFRANITTLKMGNFGETMATGSSEARSKVMRMLEEENRVRTSFGLQVMSRDDTMENHPYSFGGLAEVYELFMMDMAGAAEIPATRLFGRSPQGLNATGESDLMNYYEKIGQLQEAMLRPALDRLLPVMFVSVLGFLPDELDFVFEPLATPNLGERAEILAKVSETMIGLYQAGMLTKEQAVAELKGMVSGTGAFQSLEKEGCD